MNVMNNAKSVTAAAIAALGISLGMVPFASNAADLSQARIAQPANFGVPAVNGQFQNANIIQVNGLRSSRSFKGRGFNRGFRGRGFNRFGSRRFRNNTFFFSGSRGFRNSRFHHGSRFRSRGGLFYSR